ncbi:basic proline-rich protein-like [Eublepharis macularius]|uniref:Basic proline-rich protein-like n=1 Tax=Eublepharis macularius TaxID=481883 RepID=A0AA97KWB9_EUBMA|nr:basic proline-rich protein-like [Eublepharis macularius]
MRSEEAPTFNSPPLPGRAVAKPKGAATATPHQNSSGDGCSSRPRSHCRRSIQTKGPASSVAPKHPRAPLLFANRCAGGAAPTGTGRAGAAASPPAACPPREKLQRRGPGQRACPPAPASNPRPGGSLSRPPAPLGGPSARHNELAASPRLARLARRCQAPQPSLARGPPPPAPPPREQLPPPARRRPREQPLERRGLRGGCRGALPSQDPSERASLSRAEPLPAGPSPAARALQLCPPPSAKSGFPGAPLARPAGAPFPAGCAFAALSNAPPPSGPPPAPRLGPKVPSRVAPSGPLTAPGPPPRTHLLIPARP